MITDAEWGAYVRGRKNIKDISGVSGIGLAGPHVYAYVEKITPEILRELPETLDGIPVIAKQIGKLRIQSYSIQSAYPGRDRIYRPVPGGVSVGSIMGDTGTHGGTVSLGGVKVGISNAHIFGSWGDRIAGAEGDPILQPGLIDYMSGDTEIGQLIKSDIVPPISVGSTSIDAAIYSGDFSDEILGLGSPAPAVQMEPKMKVYKSGRSSGVTSGIIETVGAVVDVEGFGTCRFENVAITDRAISISGDSGSIALNGWAQSCGLVFAGGEGATVICEAVEVERKMGVKFGVTEPHILNPVMDALSIPSTVWAPVVVGGFVLLMLGGKR